MRRAGAPGACVDQLEITSLLREIGAQAISFANGDDVNRGHFDDLAALPDLREGYPDGAWLHVDGGFGMSAGTSPRVARRFRGIERADSVAADNHKG